MPVTNSDHSRAGRVWQRGGRVNQDGFVVKLRLRVTLTPDLSNVRSFPPYGDDATVKMSGVWCFQRDIRGHPVLLEAIFTVFFNVVSKQFAFQ